MKLLTLHCFKTLLTLGMGPNIETDEGKVINYVKGRADVPGVPE